MDLCSSEQETVVQCEHDVGPSKFHEGKGNFVD